jgi:hypothetical protein
MARQLAEDEVVEPVPGAGKRVLESAIESTSPNARPWKSYQTEKGLQNEENASSGKQTGGMPPPGTIGERRAPPGSIEEKVIKGAGMKPIPDELKKRYGIK